jgi:hypothetical protein
MPPLEALIQEAVDTANGTLKQGPSSSFSTAPPGAALSGAEAEVARVLQICNGCRDRKSVV